ncbi:MAG: nuclear transport factor 2 family protein [Acidobacteria bacterium]|nr:nuclear transport factor 2 family protein [Acidobacteriota bacterium]
MSWFGTRQKQSAVIFAAILIGLIFLNLRQAESPEVQIEKNVRSLVAAAEAKEMGPFRDLISADFVDANGRSRDEALNLLKLIYLRHTKIQINVVSLDVKPGNSADQYTVNLFVLMSEGLLPQDKGNFSMLWQKRGSEWLMTRAGWGDDGYGE